MYRIYKYHVHPDVQKADNQHTDQGSRRLHGHFQYREKSAQTIWLDGVEYICLKEKQFLRELLSCEFT